jgi:hypothetical protein
MTACSDGGEDNLTMFRWQIDEKPVGFYMALPMSVIGTFQLVIAVLCIKGHTGAKPVYDLIKLAQVFALGFHALIVLFKLE